MRARKRPYLPRIDRSLELFARLSRHLEFYFCYASFLVSSIGVGDLCLLYLWLLCPECSIVKISPPPLHLVHAFIRVFCKTTSIAWNICCKTNVLGGYCVISFGKTLILLSCDAYVCIAYIDVPKVHWQTIYCGTLTVEET